MDGYGRHGVVAAHINTLDRTLSDKLASFDTEYERWRTGQVEVRGAARHAGVSALRCRVFGVQLPPG
jgi:hypothetical protein